jgi:hypothetical protein
VKKSRYVSAALIISLALTASIGAAQERPGSNRAQANRGQANRGQAIPSSSPSVIVAAESRFERLAREKGLWRAYRENITEDAYSFTPDLQNITTWLDGRDDPEKAANWDPYHIIISCDGSMAAAIGTWQSAGDESPSEYIALWQRQRKGGYKMVFSYTTGAESGEGDPSAVTSKRSDCRRPSREVILSRAPNAPPPKKVEAPPENEDPKARKRRLKKLKKAKRPERLANIIRDDGQGKTVSGRSRDRSFLWQAEQSPDGRRTLTISILQDGEYADVIDKEFTPLARAK